MQSLKRNIYKEINRGKYTIINNMFEELWHRKKENNRISH